MPTYATTEPCDTRSTRAHALGEARQMAIDGDDAARVRDLEHVAVAAFAAGETTRPSPAARTGVPMGAA